MEAAAYVLLNRYGVMFRELLARESLPIRWREMLFTLRHLEDRGEVRGGRFVDGFAGEQFALPVAVESLRAARRAPATGDRVTVSAADPLNLLGIIVTGERVPANSGQAIAYCDGVPAREFGKPFVVARAVKNGGRRKRGTGALITPAGRSAAQCSQEAMPMAAVNLAPAVFSIASGEERLGGQGGPYR